jgi:hypothetical protein
MQLGIREKLLGAVSLVVLIMATAGAVAVWQGRQLSAQQSVLLHGEGQAAVLAQAMRAALLLQVQALKTLIRGQDTEQYRRFTTEFDMRAQDLKGLRASMEELSGSLSAEERAQLQKFDAGWAGYLAAWPKALEAYGGPGGGKMREADAVMSGKDRDAVSSLDGPARPA